MTSVYVKYLGRANVRSFAKTDFSNKGISDQDDVEFNHDNRWVAGVSPEAAGFLIGTGEFEKVTKKEAPEMQAPESEHEQQVPEPGGTIPGEKKERTKAPHVSQDEGDSHKES